MTIKDATDASLSPQAHERKSQPESDIGDGESVNEFASYDGSTSLTITFVLIEVNKEWYTILDTDESSETQALITNDPETPRDSKPSK